MEWRRIDLHIHTPASKDYQDSDATYLDILRKAEAEGLDIIAFTDHNTVAGYAAMLQELSDLERWEASGHLGAEDRARLEEYRHLREKVLVLPGFELTATLGFHVLGIFDRDTSVRTLEHVLLTLRVPFKALESGETEVGATCDVLTAYRVMAEAGALVIAAHANSSHGVALVGLGFGGQTKIAYTQDPNLHALEVTDLESKKRRRTASFFNGAKPEYPRRMHCIQGSDAHRSRGVSRGRQNLGVGERATEVLLPEVSLKALKELFLSNDFSRTRPHRRTAEPFDYVEAARNEGASIVRSFHEQMTRQGGRMHAILRDVVAFANTNGGTIYVGISPNRKVPPKGLDSPTEAISKLKAEIQRMVTPPIEVDFGVLNTRGHSIVSIEVSKGNDPPYVLEGSKIYLRQEASTGLAMRDEIVQLIKQTMSTSVTLTPGPHDATFKPLEDVEPSPEKASSLMEPPRTGVEIVRSVQHDGVTHHTMRDLRHGREVHNVTHSSARKLWRYAIALKEKHTFQENKVTWTGTLGLWHKYLRAGRPRYDLVQKDANGPVRIYYGVTDEGIHGSWKAVVGMED